MSYIITTSLLLFLCLTTLHTASSVFSDTSAKKLYTRGESIEVKVNGIFSDEDLSYDYYTLPVCRPAEISYDVSNIGGVLTGDLLSNTPFEISFLAEESCRVACSKTVDTGDVKILQQFIRREFRVDFMLDGLPIAEVFYFKGDTQNIMQFLKRGALLGEASTRGIMLNQHLVFHILCHAESLNEFSIVGFFIEQGQTIQCNNSAATPLPLTEFTSRIQWSYQVKWEESDIHWENRWDNYSTQSASETNIQKSFLLISSILILFIFAYLLCRCRQLKWFSPLVPSIQLEAINASGGQVVSEDWNESSLHAEELPGWVLIRRDVFRPPHRFWWLLVLVGTGCQLVVTTIIVLFWGLVGVSSSHRPGSLLTSILVGYTISAVVGGWVPVKIYQQAMFGEASTVDLRRVARDTALAFPSLLFVLLMMLQPFLNMVHSSQAMSFQALSFLVFLWGFSIVMAMTGACLAGISKSSLPYFPSAIAREIPLPQLRCNMNQAFCVLVCGLLPFCAIYIHSFMAVSAVWLQRTFDQYDIMAVVFVIFALSCALVSILTVTFMFTDENYEWWWPAFYAPTACSLYLFLFFIVFFLYKINIVTLVGSLYYFVQIIIVCLLLFLVSGSIGFMSAFYFAKGIYQRQFLKEQSHLARERERQETQQSSKDQDQTSQSLEQKTTQRPTRNAPTNDSDVDSDVVIVDDFD